MSPGLPSSRGDGAPYRIAVVCLGNICRSPMAEVVLNDRLGRAGLTGAIDVVSAGTGGWHVGGPMDDRAAALLADRGYDPTRHRAQRFDPAWLDDMDLVLAMDRRNLADITELGPVTKVRMFRDFDPLAQRTGDRDVPDPYFGGVDGFEAVLEIIERTSDALVEALGRSLREPTASLRSGPTRTQAGG